MANPVGRPTSYKKEYCVQAAKLCLIGAIDSQLADFFEVSEVTINTWKKEHPEFLESISEGKRVADADVEKSLYQRAMGYSHPEEKVFCNMGDITTHDTIKQYPPETAAAIFWLKNRKPKEWRDKRETELTGPEGEPLSIVWNVQPVKPAPQKDDDSGSVQ